MQSILSPFKPAKVYTGKSYWYIYYHFKNPQTGKFERFKEYFNVNRIQNKTERKIYAQEIVKFIDEKLKAGFNPFERLTIRQDGALLLHMLDYLFALMTANASKPTINTYISMINRLKRYIEARELTLLPFSSIALPFANDFTGWMKNEEKLSKKTVNSTLTHLSKIWKESIKYNLTVTDPFALVERVKRDINVSEADEDVFEPLTYEELQKVFASIGRDKRTFIRYLAVILYAWARPVEVCRLRVNQIDLASGWIKFKKGTTKNHRGGFVQIVEPLRAYLQEIDLKQYPGHFFVFSKDDYLPGPEQRCPKTALKQWTKMVVDKLEIDKRMYALKHTGNICTCRITRAH